MSGLSQIANFASLALHWVAGVVALGGVGSVEGAVPVVTNVRAAQRVGTELVDVYYDVAASMPPLTVAVHISADSGASFAVKAVSLTGAVGGGVQPGINRHIVWNAGADWDGMFSSSMRFKVTVTDASIPSGMALIPAGSFEMGSQLEGPISERPLHTVHLSAFFMDRVEVTNDLMVDALNWAYARGKVRVTAAAVRNTQGNPQTLLVLDQFCRITWSGSKFTIKEFKGAGYPCVGVTWYGAAVFCNYRSEMEGLAPCYNLIDWSCDFTANGYRLPTEAEWEKAARGGVTQQRFPWGETITHSQANYQSVDGIFYDASLTRGFHPNYSVNDFPYTSPVGSFEANLYGLYDMSGNVWEWCGDWYSQTYYSSSAVNDPTGSASGAARVMRGGSWVYSADNVRVANRFSFTPESSDFGLGFRSVRR